jgi:hypothetical protein
MAMQPTFFGRAKSIAGAGLIGLGSFVLYENLDRVPHDLSRLLGAPPVEADRLLPGLILAGSRILQAYGANHQCFLETLLLHALVSSWPLLLVAVGAVLSRESVAGDANVS